MNNEKKEALKKALKEVWWIKLPLWIKNIITYNDKKKL